MQLTLPTTLTALLTLLTLPHASAVNILWISPNYTCGATQFWSIYDAANNQCYQSGTYARSVSFQNVPSGAKGQVYTSSDCTSYYTEASSGTHCLAAPQWGGLWAANWFYPYKRLARDGAVAGRERFGVTYTLADGKTVREVEVARFSDVQGVLGLVENKDFEALARLPEFIGTSRNE
jgi:hypothetical protein